MQREEIIKLIEQKTQELNNLKELLNENTLTKEEKITIYQNTFKGRKDTYVYLSNDKNNPNKIYYIQSCQNEWLTGICNKTMSKQCKICKYRKNNPLTKEVIKKHLFNNQTITIYPLLEDETCFFLVINFDNEQINREDVTAFLEISDKYQIPVYVERDSSGKSLHTWIFFKNKIKAIIARKLGSLLLSQTMEIRYNLDINLFDKMFPNQDYLPKGNYGNYTMSLT